MKTKFTQPNEWERYRNDEEVAVFLDSSPFSEISSPRNIFSFAIQVAGARSTLYAIRTDSNDTVLLNTDEYAFNADTSEFKNFLVGPLRTEYHHTDDIPTPLKSSFTGRLQNKLDTIRQLNKIKTNS